MVDPGLATVGRAHEAAELDAHEEQVGVVGARRDPAHVRRPGPRREAPRRPRRKLEQSRELTPSVAAVVAAEQAARLGSRVDGSVARPDGEREDAGPGQLALLPRRAAVGRLADAGLAQADVDDVGILGIGGKTLRPRSLEKELDAAPVAVLVESRDSVARRRPRPGPG